jgi:BlaI family transcriptional regulator, penicillinase repressor
LATPSPLHLGKRERQIVEILYRLEEASVAQVRAALPDPPSYSAVRAILNLLVEKGVARFRHQGKKYIYRPAISKSKTSRSALRNLVQNFFASQPADAVAALVDGWAGKLTPDDLERIRRLIEDAEQKKDERHKPEDQEPG